MWKYLIKKEFKQFFRDPGLPRMVMVFPIILVLVFPFAANMEVKDFKVAIVDCDQSAHSRVLTERCNSSEYFKVVSVGSFPSEAMKLVEQGKADAVLTLENGFGEYVDTRADDGTGIPASIKVNTVNGTRGSIGLQYLNGFVTAFLNETGAGVGTALAAGPGGGSISISESYRYNPFLDYKLFMIPALIVIAITMMCGFMPTLNIVGEKEKGTIEQINVTPVSKTAFICCKMIPYVVIAFFMVTVSLLLAWLVFGYSCKGSYLAMAVFVLAHIVVMASFGLIISNYSDNVRQAMFVIWFFSMIFMLMSGIFTPIASMPDWARAITYANPLRYFADAMRGIFLKGSSLADLWFDLVCLLGLGTVTTTWAILSYRKTA